MTPDQIVLVPHPAALHHGLVDRQVAALNVLEKKSGFPDMIEKLFQRRHRAGKVRRLVSGGFLRLD